MTCREKQNIHNMTQLVSGPLDLPLSSVPVPPLHRPPGKPSAVPSSWKAKPTRRGATSAAWSARRRSWSKRPRPPSAWLRRLRRQPVSTLGWGWHGGAGGWEDVFRKIKRWRAHSQLWNYKNNWSPKFNSLLEIMVVYWSYSFLRPIWGYCLVLGRWDCIGLIPYMLIQSHFPNEIILPCISIIIIIDYSVL